MAQAAAQTISSQEHIPAGEHGRGFSPFPPHNFASQILWLALTFIALYVVMSRVALPRIGSILEDRRRHIDNDLQEAQRPTGEPHAALAAHERALSEARARAQPLG